MKSLTGEEGNRKEKRRETMKGKVRRGKENIFSEKELNIWRKTCQKRIIRMVKLVRKLRLCCYDSQVSRDLQQRNTKSHVVKRVNSNESGIVGILVSTEV